jgi:hypothetical protein
MTRSCSRCPSLSARCGVLRCRAALGAWQTGVNYGGNTGHGPVHAHEPRRVPGGRGGDTLLCGNAGAAHPCSSRSPTSTASSSSPRTRPATASTRASTERRAGGHRADGRIRHREPRRRSGPSLRHRRLVRRLQDQRAARLYPEVFAGGSVLAGVPAGFWPQGTECSICGQKPAQQQPSAWGDLVRTRRTTTPGPGPACSLARHRRHHAQLLEPRRGGRSVDQRVGRERRHLRERAQRLGAHRLRVGRRGRGRGQHRGGQAARSDRAGLCPTSSASSASTRIRPGHRRRRRHRRRGDGRRRDGRRRDGRRRDGRRRDGRRRRADRRCRPDGRREPQRRIHADRLRPAHGWLGGDGRGSPSAARVDRRVHPDGWGEPERWRDDWRRGTHGRRRADRRRRGHGRHRAEGRREPERRDARGRHLDGWRDERGTGPTGGVGTGGQASGGASSGGAGTGGAGPTTTQAVAPDDEGCACRLGSGEDRDRPRALGALALAALGALGRRRRRA